MHRERRHLTISGLSVGIHSHVVIDSLPGPQRQRLCLNWPDECSCSGVPERSSGLHASIVAVYVGAGSRDLDELNRIFQSRDWELWGLPSWEAVMAHSNAKYATHFIYDHDPADRSWVRALADTQALPHHPAFLLASRISEEALWVELLKLGGYDLLRKPFNELDVYRVIVLAWKQSGSRQKLLFDPWGT